MKKTLQKLFAAVAALLLIAGTIPVQASHYQGSELTYTCVAPNTYVVDLKLYRDCTGAAAPTTASLRINSPGCNAGRSQVMTKIGSTRIGNDYCSQIPPTCTATGPPNYEEVIFSTTVTFSISEQACQEWYLSWTECCRPATANLVNPVAAYPYAESFLQLKSYFGSSINNSSPKFKSLVVPFVAAYQPIVLSSHAVDPDGDSLQYVLSAPLGSANYSIPMDSFPGFIVYDQNITTSAVVPAGKYSPTFPLPSYDIDWSTPLPHPVVPYFDLNPANGSLAFTPALYHANTSPVQGLNKYVVVVQVNEFRQIPANSGTWMKVGHVRRDMFITVEDCGLNVNPVVTAPVANGQPITPGTIMHLRPGTTLNFTFGTDDSNSTDVLKLDSDVATLLPGATFTKTTGIRPTGTITWTPAVAHVREQVYYFHVTVQDDACPVKGQQVQTYAVRVSNTGGVTGISKELSAQPGFTAYPNPFGSTVTFKVKQTQPQQQILIYNVLGQQIDQITLKGQFHTEQEVVWENASKFPAGQYVARFNNGNGQTLKINKLQ